MNDFISFLRLLFIYVYVCVSLCLPGVCGFPRKPEERDWMSLSWSNRVINLQMWVQGTEFGSSARPGALHHYANSLVS